MSIFDNALNMIRDRQGLPPLPVPTEAELAARRAREQEEQRTRDEENRRQYQAFLDRAPRYELGDGRYARSEGMLGRLSSGAEADRGSLLHVLPEGERVALCRAMHGPRSVGWSEPREEPATCPRCLARLSRMGGRLMEKPS
jgi:hypothetical protein